MIPEKARIRAATRADVTTDKTKEREGFFVGSTGSAGTDVQRQKALSCSQQPAVVAKYLKRDIDY